MQIITEINAVNSLTDSIFEADTDMKFKFFTVIFTTITVKLAMSSQAPSNNAHT